MKMDLKMSSAKWRPFCPGEDELNLLSRYNPICGYIHSFTNVGPGKRGGDFKSVSSEYMLRIKCFQVNATDHDKWTLFPVMARQATMLTET